MNNAFMNMDTILLSAKVQERVYKYAKNSPAIIVSSNILLYSGDVEHFRLV